MSTSAIVMMILVQVSVAAVTGYFFYKVLNVPKKSKMDDFKENEEG